MAEIIQLSSDMFRPRRLASSMDDEIAIRADLDILFQIEQWARNRRHITEHGARPLHPETRRNALEALATLAGQPRNE